MKKLLLAALALIFSFTTMAQDDPAKPEKKESKGLSLEPGRTFDFELSEGSWIALDVSPDGKTIVFDFLGDIYSIPISGGSATQLTTGMQFDAQPRYSPDGTEIIFISDESGEKTSGRSTLQTKRKSKSRKATTTDIKVRNGLLTENT